MTKGPDLCVTLFRALLALCTCGACVKENDSGLCTVFTRKYVLATWRMYVWVSQGLFLSCNVNGVSCQLGGLVKWGQGRVGGGVGVVIGDWVACQWQKCNVLGYWLPGSANFAVKMDRASPCVRAHCVDYSVQAVLWKMFCNEAACEGCSTWDSILCQSDNENNSSRFQSSTARSIRLPGRQIFSRVSCLRFSLVRVQPLLC